MIAARVPDEFGLEVRVVYDTAGADAPEKAIDGTPSNAASDAAPLCLSLANVCFAVV